MEEKKAEATGDKGPVGTGEHILQPYFQKTFRELSHHEGQGSQTKDKEF